MKKTEPVSLLIVCAVIAAAAFGALWIRQSLIRDREMQEGTFYIPPEQFTYASHAYPGAATLPDLARDVCDPETWAMALIPDIQIFIHVMQGGSSDDFGGIMNPPGMEYCRIFRTRTVDCEILVQDNPADSPKDKANKQTMLDALQTLDVQKCGLIAASVTMTIEDNPKTFHYLAAGKMNERWRVLLPLDM